MRIARLLTSAALLLGPLPASATIVDEAVTFHVKNVNRSQVPCLADGASYDVAGRLVGPQPLGRSATLYLHGLGFGQWFWRFGAVAGYDYALEMAKLGHTSVVIDRIGYGGSGRPNGFQSCVGAQADVAHQVAQALRSGSGYDVAGGAPVAFQRVALGGHSAGGEIAQIEAYSFADVDALVVMAWADQGTSNLALENFAATGVACLTGGFQDGYASFGQRDADFRALMFHDAEAAVENAATAMRSRDPCGDDGSITNGIVLDQLRFRLGAAPAPTLVVCGDSDAIFPPPACDEQAALIGADQKIVLPGTGHALTLEKTAPALRAGVSAWLNAHGF